MNLVDILRIAGRWGIIALLVGFGKAAAADFERLAAPGPWAGVSEIIAYDNRIWFANSEPFGNFNAADIYSYDPAASTARYEHGLFSQGAGAPLVANGRLYWPYEDPRSNAGVGEYEVTDGQSWQRSAFSGGDTLQVHTMRQCGGALLAGTGGWEGALQQSADSGKTWREIYRIPEVQGQVSRISDILEFGDRCLFAVTAWEQPGQRMFELTDGRAIPVEAWPVGERVMALTLFEGAIFAIHEGNSARQLMRFDGNAVSAVELPQRGIVQDIAASDNLIAVVMSDAGGGSVVTSLDGQEWTLHHRIVDELPIDVFVHADQIYVGTYRKEGGALWGPRRALQPATPPARQLEALVEQPLSEEALDAALRTLNAAIAPKPDYTSYQSGLLGIVMPLAQTRSPGVGLHLSKRARRDLPSGSVMTFTQQPYSYEALARWFLLFGAGLSGGGRVELAWLSEPWTAVPRSSEKYFETPVAAIWASAFMRQSGVETIDILIERLSRTGEPGWLKGDVVAALTAITDQHFGHDVAAWARWWQDARASWPS